MVILTLTPVIALFPISCFVLGSFGVYSYMSDIYSPLHTLSYTFYHIGNYIPFTSNLVTKLRPTSHDLFIAISTFTHACSSQTEQPTPSG